MVVNSQGDIMLHDTLWKPFAFSSSLSETAQNPVSNRQFSFIDNDLCSISFTFVELLSVLLLIIVGRDSFWLLRKVACCNIASIHVAAFLSEDRSSHETKIDNT